jgi:hypothetical protein
VTIRTTDGDRRVECLLPGEMVSMISQKGATTQFCSARELLRACRGPLPNRLSKPGHAAGES